MIRIFGAVEQNTFGPKISTVPREGLEVALEGLVRSPLFTKKDTIVNINIGDFDAFNGIQCEVYHWTELWCDHTGNPKEKLPRVLVSALVGLLKVFGRPYDPGSGEYWAGR